MREIEKNVLRELEDGLPLVSDPFEAVGKKLGLSAEEVIESLRRLTREGAVRRFCAVVNHFLMGYTANAMVVWKLGDEEIDGAGVKAASHTFVSHCYRRTPGKECPWNLYAMVHAMDQKEIRRRVEKLEEAVGRAAAGVFHTLEKYKKTSLKIAAVEGGE